MKNEHKLNNIINEVKSLKAEVQQKDLDNEILKKKIAMQTKSNAAKIDELNSLINDTDKHLDECYLTFLSHSKVNPDIHQRLNHLKTIIEQTETFTHSQTEKINQRKIILQKKLAQLPQEKFEMFKFLTNTLHLPPGEEKIFNKISEEVNKKYEITKRNSEFRDGFEEITKEIK